MGNLRWLLHCGFLNLVPELFNPGKRNHGAESRLYDHGAIPRGVCRVLLSGWVADLLVRKGFSLGFARKTPIICGLLISTCIMGANYTNDPMMIMCLMALAFFGNGFASITWSLVSSLAPMRLIGLTGGVFNFAGGLGGITVPLVVGYLAQGYGFAPALVYISAVALIGALSYILLVGDVKRVG